MTMAQDREFRRLTEQVDGLDGTRGSNRAARVKELSAIGSAKKESSQIDKTADGVTVEQFNALQRDFQRLAEALSRLGT